MATATEEQRAKDKRGRTRTRTRPFSPRKRANCVARRRAFRADDNALRVMWISMQLPMQPPLQHVARARTGRSGVNSLWSPALKVLIGRTIMLCKLRYKYSSLAHSSRKDDGTDVSSFCSSEGINDCEMRDAAVVAACEFRRDSRDAINVRLYVRVVFKVCAGRDDPVASNNHL